MGLAEFASKLSKFDIAKDAALAAIKLNPNNVEPHILLGQCYFNLEDLQNAKTAFAKALELSPDNQEANKALQNVLKQLNQRMPSKGVDIQQDILFQHLKNSALINLCDIYSHSLKAYTGKSTLKTAIIWLRQWHLE